MIKQKLQQDFSNPQSGTILIDFRKAFSRILSYWWLFIIGLVIAFVAGRLFMRYATFEYSARAVLLIKDAGTSGELSEQNILLDQRLTGGGKEMDNEIQILKSLTLMEKVVERLQLNVLYYRIGNLKESELYTKTPFFVDSFALNNRQFVNFYIELILSSSTNTGHFPTQPQLH